MTMVGGLVAQRHYGAAYGFDVPLVFPALILTATFMVARLRLRAFLPWAVAGLTAATVEELTRTHGAPSSIYGCIANWMLFIMSVAGAWLLEHSFRASWLNGRRLEEQAARDALTELPNRRHFDAVLVRLVRQAVRERKSIALLMLDVDDFKAYNDRYGHPAGDECLRRISRWLGDSMRRPQDFCARLGGEEFGAVWFNASTRDAPRLAEELREGIARPGIPHGGARNRRVVTASAGFVQIVAPASEDKALAIAVELVERADRALYEAKRSGRSRMVISGPAPILRRDEQQTMELPPVQMRG
jgi:diguanylate cyclase (GGDEF)-like protein